MRKPTIYCFAFSMILSFCGCADGPLWRTGYLSPWVRKQWDEEKRLAPTLASRKQKLQELVDSVKAGSATEQEQVAKQLSQIVENDPIFLIRIEATKMLGELKTPAAIAGLDIATRDADPDVRKAAIKAWGMRGDETAANRLQNLVVSDTNLDVRLAATRALSGSNSAQALKSLALVLDDPDPAVQFRATETLAKATGEKFGADIDAWKKYLAAKPGLNPPTPATGTTNFAVRQTSGEEEVQNQFPEQR